MCGPSMCGPSTCGPGVYVRDVYVRASSIVVADVSMQGECSIRYELTGQISSKTVHAVSLVDTTILLYIILLYQYYYVKKYLYQ